MFHVMISRTVLVTAISFFLACVIFALIVR